MNDHPRGFWLSILVAVAGILLVHAGIAQPAFGMSKETPNIILCMADDQGWGDVGYHGHPVLKTPNLDEMAAVGLRLEHFYAAAPVCSPTRGSVLTGRHPVRYGCFSWGHTIRPQEITIAEALKKAGYVAGHFGKWHVGPVRADSQLCPGASGFDRWLSTPNFYDLDPLMSDQGRVVRMHGDGSIIAAEAAIQFMREAKAAGRPFLAVVWFGSPHSPHRALPEDKALYADQPENLQNFYGEITALDRAVGMLRKALRDLDIQENTIFWYTSDNGAIDVGSTGGLRGRKGQLYDGGLRVPCIIEWPAQITTPRQSDFPCGTVDIYPTLLDIVGVNIPDQPPLDGISLRPLLEGREPEKREKPLGFWVYPVGGISTPSEKILAQMLEEQEGKVPPSPPPENEGAILRQYPEDEFPGHAAWLDWPYKLHRIANKRGDVRWELYNLAEDPKESHDLSAEQPDRVRKMAAALEEWQKSVLRSLNGKDYR
ncbi:MAG: sulfatase-like hydrolase/transferase [Thermogutta sp.]|uniref:sulfatase-like hydrolase/transferase n=1 Tax=Thermogutta sp. TaxID=1962930 RepID=UPI00198ED0B9|nr:sulfatase-like hydrolase/transferase [Thermogutta sp.]MBC7352775.1 sulfatase-like hydrolase/transferase [Thermogutta sp.]